MRLVEEALSAAVPFEGVLVSPDLERTARGAMLRSALEQSGVPLQAISTRALKDLADTDTPQGVIAVVRPPVWHVDAVSMRRGGVVLVLDGVQDPGNVGTLVRTADALGASATMALKGTADPLNPKTLRGAMGATFRHPVVLLDTGTLRKWLEREQAALWIADKGGRSLAAARRPRRLAVAVGNEGAGVSTALRQLPHQRVAISLCGCAESLNVAVAAGILLYEVLRSD